MARSAMVLTVGLAIMMLQPSWASAGDGIRTYPSCGGGAGEDSHCIIGNGWGATFDARGTGREKYKLCVNPPNGPVSCRRNHTNRRGYDFDKLYTEFETIGTYTLKWKKGGHKLDKDRLYLGIGD